MVRGHRLFELCCGGRTDESRAEPDRRLVATVERYATALETCFLRLSADAFGWRSWFAGMEESNSACEVLVRELEPCWYGLSWPDPLQIVLTSRIFERSLEETECRQYATVAHELAHVFQFGTPLFRQALPGLEDPNWWLHEASAIACEVKLSQRGIPIAYPYLWDWASHPELTFDSERDRNGVHAAPLLLYLLARLGNNRLLPELYEFEAQDASLGEVRPIRGAEILSRVLRDRHNLAFASVTGPDLFASEYCVDAAFIDDNPTLLDPRLGEVVGARTVTDAFHSYPVNDAAQSARVDHLGCRYFEFFPPAAGGCCHLTVTPLQREGLNALRGELVLVPVDGAPRSRISLRREQDGARLVADVDSFTPARFQRAVLVVANCFFGAGYAAYDGLRFGVSATVD